MARRWAVAILFAWVVAPASSWAAAPRPVIFFDPDLDTTAMARVAAAFDAFLQPLGAHWRFQGTTSETSLTQALEAADNGAFAMVHSAYLRTHLHALRPLWVPASQSDIWQHKKLITAKASSAADLQGTAIAVSGLHQGDSEAHIRQQLEAMGIARAVLFGVPTDVSAVLALHLEQVDAALVVPSAVQVLKRTTPSTVATLHTVGDTLKVLRSPLCVHGDVPHDDEDMLMTALMHLADVPGGAELMRALAFDGWVPFSAGMLQ